MKRAITAVLGLSLAIFLTTSMAFSKTPIKPIQSRVPAARVQTPIQMMLSADPLVEQIYSLQCPCSGDLSSTNAFLMKDMWVTLYNGVCPGGKMAQISATLKVRYYDLRTVRWEEKNIPFTMAANSRKAIKVISGNILVKKSSGITAEIVNIQAPVKDCNPGNNRKTVRECLLPPVY